MAVSLSACAHVHLSSIDMLIQYCHVGTSMYIAPASVPSIGSSAMCESTGCLLASTLPHIVYIHISTHGRYMGLILYTIQTGSWEKLGAV